MHHFFRMGEEVSGRWICENDLLHWPNNDKEISHYTIKSFFCSWKFSESVERFVSLFLFVGFLRIFITVTGRYHTSMAILRAELRVKRGSMLDRNYYMVCTSTSVYTTPSRSEIEGLAAFNKLIKANDSCPPLPSSKYFKF